MRRPPTSAVLAALVAAALWPARAGAVDVGREGATVFVTDPAGEPGGLRVYRDAATPDAVFFTSTSGSRVRAGLGCLQFATRHVGVGPDIVACSAVGLLALRLDLAGGADSLYAGTDLDGPVPWQITATTGPGNDHVEIQSTTAVAVDLGPGSDYLLAGSQLGPVSRARRHRRRLPAHDRARRARRSTASPARDLLTGSLAPDRLIGGDGRDRFSFFGRDPANLRTDILQCGPGDDTVDTQPIPGADATCPAEIVLPRRARLTATGISLRVRVAELVKARFEIYARRAPAGSTTRAAAGARSRRARARSGCA